MDERYRPDWPSTEEEIEEYDRLLERELGEWQAEQNERIAREKREEAAARAADPLAPRPDEPEWLPISISRIMGQNAADAVESELADLEISAIDEATIVDFQVEDESPDEARAHGPTQADFAQTGTSKDRTI